jgi:aryl-alcohol dehydrogenase-like predicted oxidoreductase
MSTIKLGELSVNRLGFGAMRVLGPDVWGEPADRPGAIRLFRRAVELGVNFFDTAESYGPQTDEALIAEALHPYPKGFVVATKCGLVRPKPSRWDSDARPEKLRRDLEGSLKRLRLECIDLYQLHAPDPKVPFAESVGALARFKSEGKVRHVGLSNVSVEQLEEAQKIVPIVSVQNRYSFDYRNHEEVLRACEAKGIAFLPWYPLGDGSVLKKNSIRKLAKEKKATPSQIAIAWLLARSSVMLPIPGTSSIAHLEENLGAANIRLSAAELKRLSEP